MIRLCHFIALVRAISSLNHKIQDEMLWDFFFLNFTISQSLNVSLRPMLTPLLFRTTIYLWMQTTEDSTDNDAKEGTH